jgi:uncharacterized membrane protein
MEDGMATTKSVTTAKVAAHPLHRMLITLPIGLFGATFLLDVLFLRTGNDSFATGTIWLLGAGLITAALAALTGRSDFVGD